MKKKIYVFTTILLSAAALSLSSCLKDNRYVDFSKVGTIVEFPTGGSPNFGADAQTSAADTIVQTFDVAIASPTPPTTATTITFTADDPAIIAAYNASNSAVSYVPMPSNAYVFTTTSVTIPAGQRFATLTVTMYKGLLDPSKSYMLPIAIKSAGGYTISGNMGVHYFHFIGNDFAGAYEHFYSRWNTPDSTTAASTNRADEGSVIISPVSPTEFIVATSYYTGPNYDVTFTKTGSGASATYSNWAIQFLPGDVAPGGQWASNITVTTQPKFAPMKIAFNPTTQYTYAQSLLLFRFYFQTASRAIIDEYVHL